MKLTHEQMKTILYEEGIDELGIELVEQSKWVSDHKMQTCEVIFKQNDKYFAFGAYRQGDDWSGYETDFFDDNAIEVTKEAYTAYRWVQVTAKENPPESVSCNPEDVPTMPKKV